MLVARTAERQVLSDALGSGDPELVAVYGRRRVGKTYLVRQHYGSAIRFELTGMHDVPTPTQLRNFADALRTATRGGFVPSTPRDWFEAFRQLRDWLTSEGEAPCVIFFDELPWLASPRSGFMSAFEHFWNSWASRRSHLVVVICGSAASWMQRNVVLARGGLHNRVTRRIRLLPFSLRDARAYLLSRNIDIGAYQTLELYMAMGGIPHYLRQVRRGDSASQAIDRMCFSQEGPLRDEFGVLYQSLFDRAERHERVVRNLAKSGCGLTRQEISARADLASGGTLSKVLDELELSGFIQRVNQFGTKKNRVLLRLSDMYSRFFLRWVESHGSRAENVWATRRGTPAFRAWSGYAFEDLCFQHVPQLKRALGIEAVETTESAWRHPGSVSQQGAQIDMVIDRKDATITLCEMKFSEGPFTIDKRYADQLRSKREAFRDVTRTRKALQFAFVTTYGVTSNAYSDELVGRQVQMESLFDS